MQTLTVEQLLIEISHLNTTIRNLIKEISDVKYILDDKEEDILKLQKENLKLKYQNAKMEDIILHGKPYPKLQWKP